jgi:hypothetical protein
MVLVNWSTYQYSTDTKLKLALPAAADGQQRRRELATTPIVGPCGIGSCTATGN